MLALESCIFAKRGSAGVVCLSCCYLYGNITISFIFDLFFHRVCPQVIKAFLETSRKNSWAEVVHCKLICMLINMLYEVPSGHSNAASSFLVDQLDLIGGIESIFIEVSIV